MQYLNGWWLKYIDQLSYIGTKWTVVIIAAQILKSLIFIF